MKKTSIRQERSRGLCNINVITLIAPPTTADYSSCWWSPPPPSIILKGRNGEIQERSVGAMHALFLDHHGAVPAATRGTWHKLCTRWVTAVHLVVLPSSLHPCCACCGRGAHVTAANDAVVECKARLDSELTIIITPIPVSLIKFQTKMSVLRLTSEQRKEKRAMDDLLNQCWTKTGRSFKFSNRTDLWLLSTHNTP